uniref:Uncharacterized protein n=1 Tax=Lotharella globosa TaxID=91324 RepID=A0A6U2YS01_9EUKA
MADPKPPKDSTKASDSLPGGPSSESKNEPMLALPAPKDAKTIPGLEAGGDALKFDKLGPMVLNNDGTISRITNWDKMTDREKETTYKIISRRNKARREKLLAAQSKLKQQPSSQ